MDPLRPFANLIRSLWTGTKAAPARAADGARLAQGTTGPRAQADAITASTPVGARLQSRLAALREWNSVRARELFVEHVLLMEFGSDLARDPTFADLVQRVSAQLDAEPTLRTRLDQLLQQLATDRT